MKWISPTKTSSTTQQSGSSHSQQDCFARFATGITVVLGTASVLVELVGFTVFQLLQFAVITVPLSASLVGAILVYRWLSDRQAKNKIKSCGVFMSKFSTPKRTTMPTTTRARIAEWLPIILLVTMAILHQAILSSRGNWMEDMKKWRIQTESRLKQLEKLHD